MKKKLTYTDAVKLLGGTDSRTVSAIDKLTGGLLLAGTLYGNPLALSLFDAKAEFARLSGELVASLKGKVQGLSRFGRTERILAAHAVIVLSSYFEALEDFDLNINEIEAAVENYFGVDFNSSHPEVVQLAASARRIAIQLKRYKFSRGEQVSMATSNQVESERLTAVTEILIRSEIPAPVPQQPYEVTLSSIEDFYQTLALNLPRYILGPEFWDDPREVDSNRIFQEIFQAQTVRIGVSRYQDNFLRLAGQFPEVAFWSSMADHQATRVEISHLKTSLTGLERILNELSIGRPTPEESRVSLSRFYRAILDRPIVETGEIREWDIQIPTLDYAYVNPDFRVSNLNPSDSPHLKSWWEGCEVRDDLQGFLAGYLTSWQACEIPLLILGQPGAGKSVLTKVLAARLPVEEFLPIRVTLREVPADTDIQTQIEYAIRDATGEDTSWPELARSAGAALPIVILDGFDELLQATGINQSDYLEKIVSFQHREAIQGRPVVVIVTSRIAVADRMRIPREGAVTVRLEPFKDIQVNQWLQTWNNANAQYYRERQIRPLAAESVLRFPELAAQPLLLMLLALYDASSNALQNVGEEIGRAELYRRIFSRFAEREVYKIAPELDEASLKHAVERELLRLSVAAFAMFNRNRQWATQDELDADLRALIPQNHHQETVGNFQRQITAAQVVIGKFFFVHEAQAIVSDGRLTTCEFLHATFGEFLVARLVAYELEDLVQFEILNANRTRREITDDTFLSSLLSFALLSSRATTVEFLSEILGEFSLETRKHLRQILIKLFNAVVRGTTERPHEYEPLSTTVISRRAHYSANLLLILVILCQRVSGSDLFADTNTPVDSWRRQALLWRSQLPFDGWSWLAHSLRVTRIYSEEQHDVIVTFSSDEGEFEPVDLKWTYRFPPSAFINFATDSYDLIRLEQLFLCDPHEDLLAHLLEGLALELGPAMSAFVTLRSGKTVSAAHAILRLWIASGSQASAAVLTSAYDDVFEVALTTNSPMIPDAVNDFWGLLLHQISSDRNRLPGQWRQEKREQLSAVSPDHASYEWTRRALVKLGFSLNS